MTEGWYRSPASQANCVRPVAASAGDISRGRRRLHRSERLCEPHEMDMIEHEPFIRRCVALAEEAVRRGNAPFGALLVADGQVRLTACNEVVTTSDSTRHAELALVSDACRRLDAAVLARSTLYASTEPCVMCCGAIYWSRIPGWSSGARLARWARWLAAACWCRRASCSPAVSRGWRWSARCSSRRRCACIGSTGPRTGHDRGAESRRYDHQNAVAILQLQFAGVGASHEGFQRQNLNSSQVIQKLLQAAARVEVPKRPSLTAKHKEGFLSRTIQYSLVHTNDLKRHLLFSRSCRLLPFHRNEKAAAVTFRNGVDDMFAEAESTTDIDLRGPSVATLAQGRQDHLLQNGTRACIPRGHGRLRSASTSVAGDRSPVQLMRRGA